MPHIKDYTGKRAHMIGIGGSSMSGLAGMLVKLGVRVTGSDSARSYTTDALEQSGIHVFIGQRAENVDGADIVIYSAAIAPDIKAQDVTFSSGRISVRVSEQGELQSVNISCSGALHLILSDAPVSLSAVITPADRAFSIPQPALTALKQ